MQSHLEEDPGVECAVEVSAVFHIHGALDGGKSRSLSDLLSSSHLVMFAEQDLPKAPLKKGSWKNSNGDIET